MGGTVTSGLPINYVLTILEVINYLLKIQNHLCKFLNLLEYLNILKNYWNHYNWEFLLRWKKETFSNINLTYIFVIFLLSCDITMSSKLFNDVMLLSRATRLTKLSGRSRVIYRFGITNVPNLNLLPLKVITTRKTVPSKLY